ncbi:hypothetical protein [Streptomyces sp. enrichment culture]|uniref:hypothetical protein n=1 Tax=Streptomyces sp. enrichment culture TaxID=1795815 RepID=UPI003F573C1C
MPPQDSRNDRPAGGRGDGHTDQIVFRWDTDNLSGTTGFGPVAWSCAPELADAVFRGAAPLLRATGEATAPALLRLENGDRALLVRRAPWRDAGGRAGTVCHALMGPAAVLDPATCLGLYDWSWEGGDLPLAEVRGRLPRVPEAALLPAADSGQYLLTRGLAGARRELVGAVAEFLRHQNAGFTFLDPTGGTACRVLWGLHGIFGGGATRRWTFATHDTAESDQLRFVFVSRWSGGTSGSGARRRSDPAERRGDRAESVAERLVRHQLREAYAVSSALQRAAEDLRGIRGGPVPLLDLAEAALSDLPPLPADPPDRAATGTGDRRGRDLYGADGGPGRDPYGAGRGAERDPYGADGGPGRDPYGARGGPGRDPYGAGRGAERDPYGADGGPGRDPYGARGGLGRDPYGAGRGAERDAYGADGGPGRDPYGARRGPEPEPYAAGERPDPDLYGAGERRGTEPYGTGERRDREAHRAAGRGPGRDAGRDPYGAGAAPDAADAPTGPGHALAGAAPAPVGTPRQGAPVRVVAPEWAAPSGERPKARWRRSGSSPRRGPADEELLRALRESGRYDTLSALVAEAAERWPSWDRGRRTALCSALLDRELFVTGPAAAGTPDDEVRAANAASLYRWAVRPLLDDPALAARVTELLPRLYSGPYRAARAAVDQIARGRAPGLPEPVWQALFRSAAAPPPKTSVPPPPSRPPAAAPTTRHSTRPAAEGPGDATAPRRDDTRGPWAYGGRPDGRAGERPRSGAHPTASRPAYDEPGREDPPHADRPPPDRPRPAGPEGPRQSAAAPGHTLRAAPPDRLAGGVREDADRTVPAPRRSAPATTGPGETGPRPTGHGTADRATTGRATPSEAPRAPMPPAAPAPGPRPGSAPRPAPRPAPRTGEPADDGPRTGQSAYDGPRTGQPADDDARTQGSAHGEPRTGRPAHGDPRTGDSTYGEPRTGRPAHGDQRAGHPPPPEHPPAPAGPAPVPPARTAPPDRPARDIPADDGPAPDGPTPGRPAQGAPASDGRRAREGTGPPAPDGMDRRPYVVFGAGTGVILVLLGVLVAVTLRACG